MADPVVLNLGVVLAIATLGTSLMLVAVSAFSYARLRSLKLLFAGGAFAVLALKAGLSTWRALSQRETDLPSVALDFGILVFLYLSVAKR